MIRETTLDSGIGVYCSEWSAQCRGKLMGGGMVAPWCSVTNVKTNNTKKRVSIIHVELSSNTYEGIWSAE